MAQKPKTLDQKELKTIQMAIQTQIIAMNRKAKAEDNAEIKQIRQRSINELMQLQDKLGNATNMELDI